VDTQQGEHVRILRDEFVNQFHELPKDVATMHENCRAHREEEREVRSSGTGGLSALMVAGAGGIPLSEIVARTSDMMRRYDTPTTNTDQNTEDASTRASTPSDVAQQQRMLDRQLSAEVMSQEFPHRDSFIMEEESPPRLSKLHCPSTIWAKKQELLSSAPSSSTIL